MTRPSLLAAALLTTCSAQAFAQLAEKPVIEERRRSAEVIVTVGKELKAYPALVENLTSEGQRYAIKSHSAANKEYRDDPSWFTDAGKSRRWSFELTYSLRSVVAKRYVSVLREDANFTGGPHPNSVTDTILWDNETKKRINIRRFFKETADDGPTLTALAGRVRRTVEAEKLERWKQSRSDDDKKEPMRSLDEALAKDDEVKNGIEPKLLGIGPISLAPSTEAGKSSGLTFHYSLRCRCLCRRRIHCLRAVAGLQGIPLRGRNRDLRRRAATEGQGEQLRARRWRSLSPPRARP